MDEILELVSRAQSGDNTSRETIVKQNLQLVWSVVRRIHANYDKEDLFQVGCMGLLKAIKNFDAAHNAKFSTYAYILILSEIKVFIRDDNPVKVSRRDKELYIKIKRERDRISTIYNREPKISEIAINLETSEKEVAQAIATKNNIDMAYLYDTVYKSDGTEIMLIDKVESNKHEDEEAENKMLIKEEIKLLDKDEKRVLYLRYYKDKKQDEIAKLLNKTQVQISRIESKAIKKMRLDLGKEN